MASTPSKWAVLVGLDFYVKPGMGLKGTVNDVEDIHVWLKQNQDSVDITKFLSINTNDPNQQLPTGSPSAWPTYNNITRRLRDITAIARPGDFVYFHFSGHGALKPTKTGGYRENNDSDAALVLFDEEDGVRYLRGFDLAHIFDDIVRKQLKLTVVLDCCHAGSISRDTQSAYTHIRGVPWDPAKAATSPISIPTPARPPNPGNSVSRNATTDQHWLLKPEGYTLIAACGPTEIAGECRGEDKKLHGVLSYFLLRALVFTLTEDLTANFGSIYRHLRASLHNRFPEQHPVLLGNEFATFMGTAATEDTQHPVCSVVKASAIDQIWLNIGHAHGVCLDDELVLCPVESQTAEVLSHHTNMNKVRITAVHALQSETELIQSPREGSSIIAGWSAILVKHSRPRAQIELFEGADDDWKEALDRNIWLQAVDHGQTTLTFPAMRVEIDEMEIYTICDGSGQFFDDLPSISGSDEHAMNQVIAILEHLAKFASIENLENRAGNALLDSDFSIELKTIDDSGNSLAENRLELEHEAKLSVTFRKNTDKTLNLTILNLRPLREISRLYPSRDRGEWRVVQPRMNKNGVDFSGEVSFSVKMEIPDRLKTKGCSEVEDVFKFFVSTRPSSFAALQLPELSEQVWRPSRRSGSMVLSGFLQDLNVGRMPSSMLRGERDASEERWACRNFVIRTSLAPPSCMLV